MHLLHRTLPTNLVIFLLALLSACGGEPGTQTSMPVATLAAAPMRAPPANTVSFPANREFYRIEATATGFQVNDRWSSGSNMPVQVSADASLIFLDFTVNLSMARHASTISNANLRAIVELYAAFLNRVPDADGMAYWIQQFNAGMTLEQMANSFFAAASQYPALTGYSSAMSNVEFVKIVYKNVLGRSGSSAPPDADINYWAGELSSGKASKGKLVVAMLNSAHSFEGHPTWGWVPKLLDRKVALGFYFAIELGLGYVDPNDAVAKGMEILAQVTADNDAYIRNMIRIFDSGFDLMMATSSGSGKGNFRDCVNLDLYKAGTSVYAEMSTMDRWGHEVRTTSERYTTTGQVAFNGKVAQELVKDTKHLNGNDLASSQLKSYIEFTNDEMLTYGSTEVVKNSYDYNFDISSINTPAKRLPLSLPVNQIFTQDYVTKKEFRSTKISTNVTATGIDDHYITDRVTFLGIEPVVTPAGVFNACKIRVRSSEAHSDVIESHFGYSWIISEGTWRGMLAKVNSGNVLSEVTKLEMK